MNLKTQFITFLLFTTFFVVGCGKINSITPAMTVEAYYQALIDKDYGKLANIACASWENEAKMEFDSFAAVTTSLNNLKCNVKDLSDDSSLVTCTGKIIANYGNEVLEIDLSKQNYKLIKEMGNWCLSGYQ